MKHRINKFNEAPKWAHSPMFYAAIPLTKCDEYHFIFNDDTIRSDLQWLQSKNQIIHGVIFIKCTYSEEAQKSILMGLQIGDSIEIFPTPVYVMQKFDRFEVPIHVKAMCRAIIRFYKVPEDGQIDLIFPATFAVHNA